MDALDRAERVRGLLAELHVPVLPLKGFDLYLRGFLRPMTDVDLLVRREDVPRIVRFLEERDFTRVRDVHLTFRNRSLILDMRWDVWFLPSPEPFWTRASNGLLHAEDALLYRVAHAAMQRGRLTPALAADVEFLAPGIDWEAWCTRVIKLGLAPWIYHALSYVGNLPIERLRPRNGFDRFLARRQERTVTENPPRRPDYISTLLIHPGFRNKLRFLRESVFPTREEFERRSGEGSRLRYCRELLLRAPKLAARFLLRYNLAS